MSADPIIAELNRRWYERCAELRFETALDVDGCPISGRTVRERVQRDKRDVETERPATLDELASSGPAVSPTRCPLDVGCDEYGVCYAAAHDRPEMCPFAVDEEAIWEACSDAPPLTDAQPGQASCCRLAWN